MTAAVVKQGVEIAMPSSRRQNERSGGGGVWTLSSCG